MAHTDIQGSKLDLFALFELLSSFYKLKPVWTFYSDLWHQEDIFMRPISVNSRNGCEWKSWFLKNYKYSMKEWMRGSMENHFYTWISTSESRPQIHWKSLGCSGGDFTEWWTLALSIQDLDQKCMHLWKEITSQHLFPSICVINILQILSFFLI